MDCNVTESMGAVDSGRGSVGWLTGIFTCTGRTTMWGRPYSELGFVEVV